MISNWQNPFGLQGLYKKKSALQGLNHVVDSLLRNVKINWAIIRSFAAANFAHLPCSAIWGVMRMIHYTSWYLSRFDASVWCCIRACAQVMLGDNELIQGDWRPLVMLLSVARGHNIPSRHILCSTGELGEHSSHWAHSFLVRLKREHQIWVRHSFIELLMLQVDSIGWG